IYKDTTRTALIEEGPGGTIVENANIFPLNQTISTKNWEELQKYYLNNANNEIFFPQDTVVLTNKSTLFKVERPNVKFSSPAISAIRFNKERQQLFLADYKPDFSTVNILNTNYDSENTL